MLLDFYLDHVIFGSLFGALMGAVLGGLQAIRESPKAWPVLDRPTPFLDTDENLRKLVNYAFIFKKYAPKTYDKMVERLEILIALWITVSASREDSYAQVAEHANHIANDLNILFSRFYSKVSPHLVNHDMYRKALMPCLQRMSHIMDDYIHNITIKVGDDEAWRKEKQRTRPQPRGRRQKLTVDEWLQGLGKNEETPPQPQPPKQEMRPVGCTYGKSPFLM